MERVLYRKGQRANGERIFYRKEHSTVKCLGLCTDFIETTSRDASSHATSVFNYVFLYVFISQIVHDLMLISIAE